MREPLIVSFYLAVQVVVLGDHVIPSAIGFGPCQIHIAAE